MSSFRPVAAKQGKGTRRQINRIWTFTLISFGNYCSRDHHHWRCFTIIFVTVEGRMLFSNHNTVMWVNDYAHTRLLTSKIVHHKWQRNSIFIDGWLHLSSEVAEKPTNSIKYFSILWKEREAFFKLGDLEERLR